MYGLEMMTFNIKDGYLGIAPRSSRLPVATSWPAAALTFEVCKSVLNSVSSRKSLKSARIRLRDFVAKCANVSYRTATRDTDFAAEAVVRGHKSGLLSTADYNNLCQCETLDDVKLHLVIPLAQL